jgi:osmotically-inducible protein OsmY
MIRLLFKAVVGVVLLIVLATAAAYAFGYWRGGRVTGVTAPDVTAGRETAREVGAAVAGKAHDIGARARDAVADGTLTAKIKSKMALDDSVKARAIDVDTIDGVVRLTGTVQSARERERALLLARETDGVREVKDGLIVRPPN